MADKHMSALFKTGREVLITGVDEDGEKHEISIWMRKPTPDQQQEAFTKAQAKAARVRAALKDPESDAFLAMSSQWLTQEDPEEIRNTLVVVSETELRNQAQQDIMYGDFGSNWGTTEKDGEEPLDWAGTTAALFERRSEIREHNKGLAGTDSEFVAIEDDAEVARLQAIYDKFAAEVEVRLEELKAEEDLKYRRMTDAELNRTLVKKAIELESGLAYVGVYNNWMQYFSCRHLDDHKRLYFASVDQMLDLPVPILAQLSEHYRDLDIPVTDLKALRSPASSSPSSEPLEGSEADSRTSTQTE